MAQYCDEIIIVITDETFFKTESNTARISYLTIMDILYVNLMYTDLSSNFSSLKQLRTALNKTRDPR